jgi:anti-sigma factor RsiW
MMLTCRKVAEILIDFVDGTLPDEQRSLLERHLCGCVPCAIYIHTYSDTIRLSRALPDEPLPPEFATRLKAMIDEACPDRSAPSS